MKNALLYIVAPALTLPVSGQETSISFSGPDALEVRTEVLQWIASLSPDPSVRRAVVAEWADDSAVSALSDEDLLDHVVTSFAAVDGTTQRLLESSRTSGPLEEVLFDGIREQPIYRNQIRLFRAKWLTQHRLFDEALAIYQQLSPDDVVDPAGLFFYRAVCQSQLLMKSEAADNLSLLLNHTLEVPPRFRTVASILQKELGGRKDDDLSHVSRLMSDVQRRLDLGRSGQRVQEQQEAVIAAIDQLLEKAENKNKARQDQGSQGGQNPNRQPSGSPASKSIIQGSKAPGEADRKELKETGGWGMLNRREEAKARELIRQQFPANYLDIISEYNRRIAEQE